MTKDEILSRLKTVISSVKILDVAEVEGITPETSLKDDLAMESIDMIDLVLTTETTFNIHTNMEELKGIHTVGEWIDYIEPIINGK